MWTKFLEQGPQIGGLATTFVRKKIKFDASIHHFDGIFNQPDLRSVSTFLGVDNPDFYERVDNLMSFYIAKDGKLIHKVKLYSDKAKLFQEYGPLVTKDRLNFEQFNLEMSKIYQEFSAFVRSNDLTINDPAFAIRYPTLYQYRDASLGQVCDKMFYSGEVKGIFRTMGGLFSEDTYNVSFIFVAYMIHKYFEFGAYKVKGGATTVLNHLKNVIEENRGSVLCKQTVTKVIVKNGQAIGVTVNGKDIFATNIIINAPLPYAVKNLVPELSKKFKKSVFNLKESISAMNVYLSFKRKLSEIGHTDFNAFFIFEDKDKDIDKQKIKFKGVSFIDYGGINSELHPQGNSTGCIIVYDKISDWTNLARDEYETKKKAYGDYYIDLVDKYIPGVKKEIEFINVATPKTINTYSLAGSGSVYGFAYDVENVNKKLQIDFLNLSIKNLDFASSWPFMSGFSNTFIYGVKIAKKILKEKF
ncbi:MAG: FAD-dependent oxidoreductase [Bacteriovoracaceae bacterium]